MKVKILFIVFMVYTFTLSAINVNAPKTHPGQTDYTKLLLWQFGAKTIPVPPEGITLTKDTAKWTLESGSITLMEPTADGTITGLVFNGKGHFTMTIPDHFEVNQLRRFSEKPEIDKVDTEFSRIVLRTSSKILAPYAANTTPGSFQKNDLAADRHEKWLKHIGLDVDARIVSGLLFPGDDFLLVDTDTHDFGWLLYQFDPFHQEEITLTKIQKMNDYPEVWISMDRPEERDIKGRPTSQKRQAIDVTHVDFDVNLMDASVRAMDFDDPEREWIHFKTKMTFTTLFDGLKALHLELNPYAKVKSVTTPDGANVPFLRDATGKRFGSVSNEVSNEALVVLLEKPTQKGETRELIFEYDLKLYNYASGRSWYPGESDSLFDTHTGKFIFTLPKNYQVRAVGTPEQVKQPAKEQVSVWNITRPTKMIGFSYGKEFKDEKIKVEGLPEIISFGTESGFTTGNMVRNVGADIANAMNFYQQYFGVKIPSERIYAARILGFHGQAFEGFIHLSFATYDEETKGDSEQFRSHETAHQYWGHLVGWKSYRDQWISESFAQYSSFLFLQYTLNDKEKSFNEYLGKVYFEQTGEVNSLDSFYLKSYGMSPNKEDRKRIGPIAAGYRASTAQVPQGYSMQSYNRGAMVLHMIRKILWAAFRDRDVFREVLQDFLKTYSGKLAGVDDFKMILQKHTNMDWTSFFENWVYGTAVPTYTWSYSVTDTPNASGKIPLTLKVKQTNVPQGFSASVPIRIDYDNNKSGYVWVNVDMPEKTFNLNLGSKPKKVTFNPDYSVLAKVNKD